MKRKRTEFNPNYFFDLPYDIILHIFSFLPRTRYRQKITSSHI